MRKLGIGLVALVVLLAAVVLLAPVLVPQGPLKTLVQDRVRAATGRELTLGGDLSLSLIPHVTVNAADVALAGADGKPLARIGELRLALSPLPLLRGAVEVDRFVLVRPVIDLAIDAQGRPNWRVDRPAAPPAAANAPAEGGTPSRPLELALGEGRIEDGTVTYADARSGISRRVEAIRLDLRLPSLDAPMQATGSAQYGGKDVALAVEAGRPRALMEGKASPLAATIDGPGIKLTASGNGGAPGFTGKLDADVADLPAALAWTGAPAPEGAALPKRVTLQGGIEAMPQRVALDGLTLAADQNRLTGRVAAELAGARPAVQADLAGEVLDLRPFMNAPTGARPPAAGGPPAPAPAPPPGGWPDDLLGLPVGLPVDLDAKLAVAGIRAGGIETGPTRVTVRGRAERIRVDLEEARLYGGRLAGNLRIEGNVKAPELRLRIDGDGLRAGPMLTAFAGFERIVGTMRTAVELSGPARSIRALVQGLDGRGSLRFTDGAIVGVDIAGMVRRFTEPGAAASGPQRTDFAELGGSFTIQDGIVTNPDLVMLAPLIRLAGTGQVDLPARAFRSYRVTPRAVATIKGQGGRVDARGLSIPFVLDGPWAAPKVTPDLAGAASALLEDPKAMQRLGLDKVLPKGPEGQAVEGLLKGLLGGSR